ncbi:MAG TPA: TIGR03435 family protein [Vicinamibacterales bacterium]|jgi:uncharacterized protein (TIGR03435 family)|nr:TIGR03435 family protein [Vicinamibacterales bacterium]
MRSAAKYLVLLFALLASISAQTSDQDAGRRPAFEVASVKRNVTGNPPTSIRSTTGRFTATNAPLMLLLSSAYRLAPYQYAGLPSWADSERFDIAATAPGATVDQVALMLRSLLADRFKMVAHMETRDAPIYAIVVARADRRLGPQITRSSTDCTAVLAERQAAARSRGPGPVPVPSVTPGQRPVCNIRATTRQTSSGGVVLGYTAGSITMARFAEILSIALQFRRQVVDRTALEGAYDFDLEYARERPATAAAPGEPAAATPIDDGPSIFTALEEQLGLKLESTRAPVEYLVIDSVEKPTDN